MKTLQPLSRRLPAIIVGLSLLSIVLAAGVSYFLAANALTEAAESKFTALASAKNKSITSYLESIEADLVVMGSNATVAQALDELNAGFDELAAQGRDPQAELQKSYISGNPNPAGEKQKLDQANDFTTYSQAHGRFHPWLRQLLEVRGYYDIFLIDEGGSVIYTVFKEPDFATNVVTGEWKDTGLGKVFKALQSKTDGNAVAFTDFEPYAASSGAAASFLGSPVVVNGQFKGVIVYQMPIGKINEVMQTADGMGESGETYLVGGDYLMRSDSRFSEESTVLKSKVEGPSVKAALEGQSGSIADMLDYRGISVLSVYSPVEFEGVRWAMIAEIDTSEMLGPVHTMRNISIIFALVIAVAVTVIAILVARGITTPILRLTDAMACLAKGDDKFDVPEKLKGDEIGQMWQAMKVLLVEIRKSFQLGEIVRQMPLNVLMADARDQFKISYANDKAKELLVDLRKKGLLPIEPSQVIGQSFDIFHKHPDRQRQLMSNPANLPYQTKIKLGDDTADLKVTAIYDKDRNYIGPMVVWTMVTRQFQIANRVKDVVGIVSAASTEMESTARTLTATADNTSHQAQAVSAAATQATTNVQTVASAAEELSSSVSEISRQVQHSTQIVNSAVIEATQASQTVKSLAEAAGKIGDVANLIAGIAGQTNLLALNATIEAARAGEAGKGFAVVASEVKNLAAQTAKATEEISSHIAAIQAATGNAVTAIEHITGTINEINQVSSTVAAAVEEQGAATQEIARNVQQAAAGTQEVSHNITLVNQGADETGQSSGQMLEAAQELSRQANELKTEVEGFLDYLEKA